MPTPLQERLLNPKGRAVSVGDLNFTLRPVSFAERMQFLKDLQGAPSATKSAEQLSIEEQSSDMEIRTKATIRLLVACLKDTDGQLVFPDGEDSVTQIWEAGLGPEMQQLLKEAKTELDGGPEKPEKKSGEIPNSSSPA